jgi:uncharacterized protein
MEQFWRNAGIQLGKRWKVVVVVMGVISGVLALGAAKIEFATGQDSYLNPDSQTALDNVAFQDDFGGETIILLFAVSEGSTADITDLYEGANLAELQRLGAEIEKVNEVYSAVTPFTSLTYSAALVGGPTGTAALTGAVVRDEAGAEARSTDIGVSLARRSAVGEQDQWVIGNPAWNELLIFDNSGYTVGDDNQPVPPAADARVIRKSLRGTFPNVEGFPANSTAVGGIVLNGNASLDELTAGTEKVGDILDSAQFEGFDLTVTGSPIYLGDINSYLKGGMLTLGLTALAVMAVILGLIFKVRWRLLPLLAVLVGVFWSFSILGLIGIDLSLVTISGLPILIGMGMDFAIQVHNRVEEEVVLDKQAHPIAETLANIAPPLIASTVAAILAFVALRISKVPMIRDFGVLLAIGIGVLVVVGIIVPISALGIREWTKPTDVREESAVERLVVKLGGLPTKLGVPMIVLAAALFVGGVLVEDRTKIQSDPVKWIDQSSQTVKDIDYLAERTEFATTLGILVTANNVYDQQIVDLIYDFTKDAEARPQVVATSSLVGTMEKIIDIDGATPIAPTSNDVVNAATAAREAVPAIARVLVNDDNTATQVNLRLQQGSLDKRAVLVKELAADLDARIGALDIPADSILLTDLPEGQAAVKATPAGLATVGIGLLENLSANRANLTYLALCLAGLYLVLRLRSLTRALLALVPVVMAVGASSLFVGLLGFELSPLTTVSGPLVIASCAEFSVLILGRYLEERQRGLSPKEATYTAASRTGRAFFTSALTIIGGFAVLIFSPLPLLSDFGIIVTLNVAIALLAALAMMPPLSEWVDEKGWLGTQEQGDGAGQNASMRMAANPRGSQLVGAVIGAIALAAGVVAVYTTADTDSGSADVLTFAPVPLPTTTTTTEPPPPPPPEIDGQPPSSDVPATPEIDPSTFGVDRPTDSVQGTVFDLLVGGGAYTGQGIDPIVANCAIETTLTDHGATTLTLLAAADPTAAENVKSSVAKCGVEPDVVDAALAEFAGR